MAEAAMRKRPAILLLRSVAIKRLAALLPLFLVSTEALAGKLRCSFTEPFFTIEFDSETGQVVFTSSDEFDEETGKLKPRVIAEGARIRRPGAWQGYSTLVLEVPGQDAATPPTTIVEMKVTGQADDGMSEFVFPFEGHYGQWVGGCESSKAPAYNLGDAYDDLGVVYSDQ
jgi:hypothetical protein